ncbi:zeatin O-glucosyltransferase-like [Tasmannia lanceolata]|uniref:zeatin O-glucosyltransferase-like n=1 Tax=Tasmannia lanceolata TaxID=3420 RepID=UPI0040638D9D
MENLGEEAQVAVVIVPLPAQGHLNSLLHFSRLISSRGVPVHFTGSATHNRQAKTRIQGWDPLTISNIHFHDLPLPPFPVPPPDPRARNKFPAHLQPSFDAAVLHLRQPFAALLRSLCSTTRHVAVIHDSVMSFAAEESGAHANAEAYCFHSVSAFSAFFFQLDFIGWPSDEELKLPVLPAFSMEGCFTDEFIDFMGTHVKMTMLDAGHIYNSCRAIESVFLDLVSKLPNAGKTHSRPWVVGPLHPITLENHGGSRPRHKCLEWLDKQPPRSVLYVSFGSNSSVSEEEIYELAMGLKQSEQRFVWVLREADRGDIFAEESKKNGEKYGLPENYELGLEELGIVVRDWAPQLEILAHQSTGGFLSHCGWNSCMESMSFGVPLGTWPMHSDQPFNAMLVTEVLRIGVPVREWARHEEIVRSADVEVGVRRLMGSEEGMEMRRRAEELGGAIREALLDGGSSKEDLDSFIAHISK